MSNAMRMGKRSLAGVAVGALGAALIPFVGVGTASAAVTTVTQPAAVRGGVATAATGYAINGTSLGSSTADAYVFSVLSGTQFGGGTPSLADAGGSNSPDVAGTLVQPGAVTFAAANAGTTVIVGVYSAVSSGVGNCSFTALGVTGAAPTATNSGAGTCSVNLVSSFAQPVGGAIASIAMTPATATTVVGEAQTYTITATDSTGRRTLTASGDSITSVSGNPAVATAGAFTQSGDSMSIAATGVGAGSTTITAVPQNNAVTPVQSAITVTANGATSATTDVTLSGSNIIANATTVGARTYYANPTVTSFTFSVSGLTAGATYRFTTTGTATESPASGVITASASGTASQVVTVTSPAAAQTVLFTVIDNGGNGNKTATAAYQAPVFAWQAPTPAAASVLFGTASGTLPVPVKVADQYGNPAASTVLTLTQGGTTVDTELANASGEATVTANVPATGGLAYTLTPTGAGVAAGALAFTVQAGTVDITTTSGLSTSTVTVTVPSWTDTPAAVVTADTTPVVMNVAQGGAGINGVPVTITAGPDVLLFAAAPGGGGVAYTTGVTSLSLTSAGGGNVNFWATSTKSGVVSVTATAGGSSLTGNFTGGAPAAAAARNVTVDAPAEVEAGGVAIVTVTAKDNFGSAVAAANVTLAFDSSSPGYFANGSRSATLVTGTDGKAQIAVTAGINESGLIKLNAGAAGEQQFGAAANRLTSAAVTDNATGYTASDAPRAVEIAIGDAEKALVISGYRSGGTVIVEGEATGFARGDSVNIRVKYYNANKKKYSSWKGVGSALVKGSGAFIASVSTDKQVKIKVNGGGVVSNIVTVK